jgi:hypothetical protein
LTGNQRQEVNRLTFRSHILEFIGESYRLRRQLQMHQTHLADDPREPAFDSLKVAIARLPNPE